MAKRAKRGKTEALALPVAGRVAIGAVAAVALGYGLLWRPASVQPIRKQAAHQVPAPSSPTPSTPVHVSAPVQAPASVPVPIPAPALRVETPKAA